MRKAWPFIRKGAPIALLLVLALGAALVARDAAAIRNGMKRDDLAFQAQPAGAALWDFDLTLPYADQAFGIKDDLIYRRALQTFARDQSGVNSSAPAARAEAQAALSDAENSGQPSARRSRLANLQGVVAYDEALADPFNQSGVIGQSLTHLERAVKVDPSNADAKYNLEFLIRLFNPENEQANVQQRIPEYAAGRSSPGGNPNRRGHGY
jgi:hypothetical protein